MIPHRSSYNAFEIFYLGTFILGPLIACSNSKWKCKSLVKLQFTNFSGRRNSSSALVITEITSSSSSFMQKLCLLLALGLPSMNWWVNLHSHKATDLLSYNRITKTEQCLHLFSPTSSLFVDSNSLFRWVQPVCIRDLSTAVETRATPRIGDGKSNILVTDSIYNAELCTAPRLSSFLLFCKVSLSLNLICCFSSFYIEHKMQADKDRIFCNVRDWCRTMLVLLACLVWAELTQENFIQGQIPVR